MIDEWQEAESFEGSTLHSALGGPAEHPEASAKSEFAETISLLRFLNEGALRGVLTQFLTQFPGSRESMEAVIKNVARRKIEQRDPDEIDAILDQADKNGANPEALVQMLMQSISLGNSKLRRDWSVFTGATANVRFALSHVENAEADVESELRALAKERSDHTASITFMKRLILKKLPDRAKDIKRFFEESDLAAAEVDYRARIFFSHGRADLHDAGPKGKRMEEILSTLKHDKKVEVWQDVQGIQTADDFQERILNAIIHSDRAVVMLGNASIRSEWVFREIQAFQLYGIDIVPILVEDIVPPDQEKEPEAWARYQEIRERIGALNYIDVRKLEPLPSAGKEKASESAALRKKISGDFERLLPLNDQERFDRFYKV